VQNSTLWRTLLGVDKTIVEAVDLDVETGILVASVRPTASMRNRCGSCWKRCPRCDAGDGRRPLRNAAPILAALRREQHRRAFVRELLEGLPYLRARFNRSGSIAQPHRAPKITVQTLN
jgi:hypothetical protein